MENESDFSALEGAWRRLETETRASLFSSFDYIHTAWNYYIQRFGIRLLVLVSENSDSINTIAPFFIHRERMKGIPYRQIRFIAEWGGDRPGILTTLPEEVAWRQVIEYLVTEVKGWDAIDLADQPTMAPGGKNWGFLAHPSCYWEQTPDNVGYYISMRGSWASYLDGIDTKVRSNLRNRTRRLSKRPQGFTVECFTRPEEMQGALARFVAIERSGWKKDAGGGVSKDEHSRVFYEHLSQRLAEKGNTFVYILKSGQDDLSAAIIFRYQGRLYARHIAFSPAFSEYSPGIILKVWILENWFNRDCEEYDLLGMKGNARGQQAKIDWATGKRETVRITGYKIASPLLPVILGKKMKRFLESATGKSSAETPVVLAPQGR